MKRARQSGAQTVQKIISGGQVGADRVALEVARELRIPTGGWAPRHFMTSKGRDPTLHSQFGLREVSVHGSTVASYITRTCKNVDEADGTIVVRLYASRGSDKTIAYAMTGRWPRGNHVPKLPTGVTSHRPCLVIRTLEAEAATVAEIVAFVEKHRLAILNVAGHRTVKGMPDYASRLRHLLELAFSHIVKPGEEDDVDVKKS